MANPIENHSSTSAPFYDEARNAQNNPSTVQSSSIARAALLTAIAARVAAGQGNVARAATITHLIASRQESTEEDISRESTEENVSRESTEENVSRLLLDNSSGPFTFKRPICKTTTTEL